MNQGRASSPDNSMIDFFNAQLKTALRSQADYVMAQRRAVDVLTAARDVLVYHEGQFGRILDMYKQCENHRWNSSIYEAWAWETANRVRRLADELDHSSIGAEALIAIARSEGVLDVTRAHADLSIHEAQRVLYGA